MKKIFSLIIVSFILVGCSLFGSGDAKKFKMEYEILNNRKSEYGNTYLSLDIDSKNPIIYANAEDVINISNNTGVIYFGFSECPWCRSAVPALLDAAKENNIDKIYYFNLKDIRDILELDSNGEIKTVREKTEEYKKVYDALYDYLDVYDGLGDETIKRIYTPTVLFFKDGKLVYKRVSTLESHMDAGVMMNELEFNVLKKLYGIGFERIK